MRSEAILCDIEGVTTSIAFVHRTLFKIAHNKIEEYVNAHWENPDVQSLQMEITPFTRESVIRTLREWIDADRKHTALKAIQGEIWKESFESGEVRSHIYEDVPPAFAEWKRAGKRIAIFSSGSVQAQQLLFRYTEAGDLTPYLSAYFDTTMGRKQEATAYTRIAEKLALPPGSILFLSDTVAELDAAREAGMQTIQVLREGAVAAGDHATVFSFFEIAP